MPPTKSAAGPDAHRSPGEPALPAWRVGVAALFALGGLRSFGLPPPTAGSPAFSKCAVASADRCGSSLARCSSPACDRTRTAASRIAGSLQRSPRGASHCLGLAAVVTVAALGGAAAMIGWWLLVGINASRPDPLSATMAGAVAIAAVIGATAAIKWHAPATYALALTTSAIALRRQLPPLLQMATAWWAPRPHGVNRASLLPLALLAATLSIHAVIAAKPGSRSRRVGDASAGRV